MFEALMLMRVVLVVVLLLLILFVFVCSSICSSRCLYLAFSSSCSAVFLFYLLLLRERMM